MKPMRSDYGFFLLWCRADDKTVAVSVAVAELI